MLILTLLTGAASAQSIQPASPLLAGFQAGGGVYYVKPHWTNNPAYGIFKGLPVNGESYSQFDFDWDFKGAWDIWLQYVSPNGAGLRTRYWQFDHGVSLQSDSLVQGFTEGVVLPRPYGVPTNQFGDALFQFQNGLQMDLVDIEALQQLGGGGWFWELSGGLRWAAVKQDYMATIGGPSLHFLQSRNDFNGIGPLLAVQARRAYSQRLTTFGKARGVLLFGETQATGQLGRLAFPIVDSTFSAVRWNTMPVVELELGASYNQPIGAITAFTEIALVGSTWFGAGNGSSSGPLEAGTPGGNDQPTFGTSTNENLGLVGGRFTAGLRY
jgi:hypothetical protein